MKKEGKIQISGNYQIYELTRKTKGGGGLAIGVMDELEPIWVGEGDDETEVIIIEVNMNGLQVTCLNGYAPQENSLMDKKVKFWARLGFEVEEAANNNKAFLLQMDGNLHIGPEVILGDPNPCNVNGKHCKKF